ncbi:nitroreductase family protein [Thermodesulfobacteriota bacterium]
MLAKDVLEVIKARRSTRKFLDKDIDNETLNMIFDATRYAPSNTNRQAWEFLLVKNDDIKNQIHTAVKDKVEFILENMTSKVKYRAIRAYTKYFTFFKDAPVLIVALYKKPSNVANLLMKHTKRVEMISGELISLSMACQNLQLMAHSLDIGTCVLTGPLVAYDQIKELLSVEDGFEIGCFIAAGHPTDEEAFVPRRKNVEKIIKILD